jgi:hypothetical protein
MLVASSADCLDERHESASTRSQQVWIAADGFVFRVVGIGAGRFSETKDLIRLRGVRHDACDLFNCKEKRGRVLIFFKLFESILQPLLLAY